VQTAMLARLPYTVLRDAIFTHPPMAEGLTALFANVPARQFVLFIPRRGCGKRRLAREASPGQSECPLCARACHSR
jgi:hypothetical protein